MIGELIDVLFESTPHKILFFMILITIFASILLAILEKQLARREKTEEDRLFYLARDNECSEFDIFQRTGSRWNIPLNAIREDFKRYLYYDEIPFYVRSYLNSPDRDMPLHEEGREERQYSG